MPSNKSLLLTSPKFIFIVGSLLVFGTKCKSCDLIAGSYTLHTICRLLLSRANATYVVIMPNSDPQILAIDDGLPTELAESLLAAASFSIHANRIVFCEGVEGPSLDQALYMSWFNSDDTAVIPVESCENVVQCTSAFGNSSLVIGVTSVGLID